jgi:DNA-binding GntR family transcriptional regulator
MIDRVLCVVVRRRAGALHPGPTQVSSSPWSGATLDVYDILRQTADSKQHRLTAHQMVRETLRQAILSGRLTGGTRLVQADIAATLDVSTTPVREALIQLASEGLIQFDAHRGAIVHEIDLGELRDIYEMRTALEPIAVRRAAQRITDDQLDAAAGLIQEMDENVNPETWVERNWQFHFLIEQAAGSPRLGTVIKTVQNSAILYIARSVQAHPGRMREGNDEHRSLLAALRKRDEDRAAAIMVQHLNNTMKAISRDSSALDGKVAKSAPLPRIR